MKNILKYVKDKKISETTFAATCSARFKSDINKIVLISAYKKPYFSPIDIAKLKYEYTFLKNNPKSGFLKVFEIIDAPDEILVVLEYFDGIPLNSYIEGKPALDIKSFLVIAENISENLNIFHDLDISHNHITPFNILINRDNDIRLIHFSIPQIQNIKNISIFDRNIIKQTLPYISPEQTGRIERSIDYRTDFYSLGIVFYELLTFSTPFKTNDPLEIIHSHLAKTVTFPQDMKIEIPEIINELILKLTSKMPGKRYYSTEGLIVDLKKCLNNYMQNRKIEKFELGLKDISSRFDIHHKLYGRENEIKLIKSVFEKVKTGNAQFMLVSGQPGIGKSSLINETIRSLATEDICCVSGKFDKINNAIPYSGLIEVFHEIIKRLLSQSDQEIEKWRQKLINNLGINGQIIIEVIPKTELIIGKQPPVMPLGPVESEIRFNYIFQNFIKTFVSDKHPLIIFLDDLQWIDSASLELIRSLISESGLKHLFIIGAYRDNEVDKFHILANTINYISEKGMQIHKISLKPLEEKHIHQLIEETLECGKDQTEFFTKLVNEKTGGNPFFIYQYLYILYKNKMTGFGCFSDLYKINNLNIPENIIGLMIEKIQTLSAETRKCLEYAACFGNNFEIETLAFVYNKNIEKTYSSLAEAAKEGFIINSGNDYKFYHDKIAEAISSLIPEKVKKEMHYKIGKIKLEKTSEKELHERIFDIANHLDFALGLIRSSKEKIKIAELNLEAAKKAKRSNAYNSALKYSQAGVFLLDKDCWSKHYLLSYSLYLIECECHFLSGHFDEAEKLFESLFKKVKLLNEKAGILNLKLNIYSSRGKFNEASRIGIGALKLYGMHLPEYPADKDIADEFLKAKINLGSKKIKDIIDLKELSDPEKLIITKILMDISISAYLSNPKLFSLAVLKVVNISLEQGNSQFSSFAYMIYGLLLTAIIQDIETGYEFAQLGLELNKKFENENLIPKLYELFGGHIAHWKLHLRISQKYIKDAYACGLKTGDINFANFSSVGILMIGIAKGDNLNEIYHTMTELFDFFKNNKDENAKYFYLNEVNFVLKMTDLPATPFKQITKDFDKESFFVKSIQKEEPLVLKTECYAWKLMLNYILGDHKKAFMYAKEGEKYFQSAPGIYTEVIASFYYLLTIIKIFDSLSGPDKNKYEDILNSYLNKLEVWTKHCPDNFENKYLLVKAELCRLKNKSSEAIKLYDQAIELANQNEFTHEEAVANELAGEFYLEKRDKKTAEKYIEKAIKCYTKWGAGVKVKNLKEKYAKTLTV